MSVYLTQKYSENSMTAMMMMMIRAGIYTENGTTKGLLVSVPGTVSPAEFTFPLSPWLEV